MKTQMKEYFTEKLLATKDWVKRERWFLLLLAFVTISLFVSMFSEYALLAVFVVGIVGAILFDFEKSLCIFLFCYSFEAVFYVVRENKLTFTFTIFYSIIFFINCVKYLILVIKKQKKFNYKILLPLAAFILYILIPINKIKFDDVFKYIVAFGFIYLILELKDNLKFENIITIICLAMMISFLFTLFVSYSDRMTAIMGEFYNYGVKKRQGMFTNPNWLAVYAILVISILFYNFVFNDIINFIPLTIIVFYTYGTLSRDYFLCFIFLIIFIFVCTCVSKRRKGFVRFLVGLLLMFCVVGFQVEETKIYATRVESVYSEACELFGIQKKDIPYIELDKNYISNPSLGIKEGYWIDGTPLDPGRVGLWKRYINSFSSSYHNIFFGAGVSADILGVYSHNSYINILWQFGIIGTLILLYIFAIIGRELIKGKKKLSIVITSIICFISVFESNVFNYVAIMMISLLILSSKHNDKVNRPSESIVKNDGRE